MKKYLSPQFQKCGCGVACIKSVMGYLAKDPNYRFLEEPDCAEKGLNIDELIAYGEKHGLFLSAYRVKPEELLEAENFPLLLIHQEAQRAHMVIAFKAEGKRLLVYDPARGLRREKKEDAIKRFSGIFLTVNSFSPILERQKERKAIPDRLWAPSWISSFLAMAFFLMGSMLLGSSLPAWVPFALFGAGAFFLLLFVVLSSWGMQTFDRLFGGIIRDGNKEKERRKFKIFHLYKQQLFGSSLSSLFSLVLSLSLASGLAFRDPSLGVTFLIALGFLCLSWLGDVPFAKQKKEKIAFLEERILKEDNNADDIEGSIKECLRESASYGRYFLGRGIAFFVLVCIICIGSLALQNKLTFDGFIYYLFPVFFFVNQVDSAYLSHQDKPAKEKLKEAFVWHFCLASANTRTQEAKNSLE